jgi:hypothetical protein
MRQHNMFCFYVVCGVVRHADCSVFNVGHFTLLLYYIEVYLLDHYTHCFVVTNRHISILVYDKPSF